MQNAASRGTTLQSPRNQEGEPLRGTLASYRLSARYRLAAEFGDRLEALVAGVFFGGQHRSLVCAPLAREAEAPGRLSIGSTKELADGRVTSAGDVATATLARDTATRLCLPHDRHGVRSARVGWRACNRSGRHRLAAHTAEGDGDVVVGTRR